MTESEQAEGGQPIALKKDRSPSFPFITLTKAVERTRELFTAGRRHEMRLPEAAKAMGYGAKSSGAAQTLAALIAYGLVEDSGAKETRKFRVSDLGFKILEDMRPGARESALAEAAMAPKMIAEYAAVWGDGRPVDAIAVSTLRFDDGFTEDGAKGFLRVFDDAMTYAKVGVSDSEADKSDGNGEQQDPPNPPLSVGDWVSVEAAGQLVFEKTRVRAIEGDWVFVEASKSGIKMSDVTLIETGTSEEVAPELPFNPPIDAGKPSASEEMDRFTVDEGVVKIIFPSGMTPDSVEELEQFFQLFIKKAKRRANQKYDL
jgi:hypothetical protein